MRKEGRDSYGQRFAPLAKQRTQGVTGRGRGRGSGEEGRGEEAGRPGGRKLHELAHRICSYPSGRRGQREMPENTDDDKGGGGLVGDLDLRALQAVVTECLPTFKGREKSAARKYREIAMETASPCRFAAESLLVEYGFLKDRAPPYEKRFSGT